MSTFQKIRNIITAVLMIISSVIMLTVPEDGFLIVTAILCFSLIFYAIRQLIYYFTMARLMVGGKTILCLGILALDCGFFTLTLTDIPKIYVIIYLIVIYAFSGVIGILRAVEAKKNGSPMWKGSLITAVIMLAVAVCCGVFIGNIQIVVYVYCAGLIYTAVDRIITVFRKTEIVYIQ